MTIVTRAELVMLMAVWTALGFMAGYTSALLFTLLCLVFGLLVTYLVMTPNDGEVS